MRALPRACGDLRKARIYQALLASRKLTVSIKASPGIQKRLCDLFRSKDCDSPRNFKMKEIITKVIKKSFPCYQEVKSRSFLCSKGCEFCGNFKRKLLSTVASWTLPRRKFVIVLKLGMNVAKRRDSFTRITRKTSQRSPSVRTRNDLQVRRQT